MFVSWGYVARQNRCQVRESTVWVCRVYRVCRVCRVYGYISTVLICRV